MQSKLIEALAVGELSWQDYANCRGADADLFFPARGASTRKSKAICADCQVRQECLEFAIQIGEKFGIWGGMAERRRRKIRRQRQWAARRASGPFPPPLPRPAAIVCEGTGMPVFFGEMKHADHPKKLPAVVHV